MPIFTFHLRAFSHTCFKSIKVSQHLKLLVLTILCFAAAQNFAQNHSFGYLTPICKNAANPSPTVSANFVSGGTFLGSAGLSINASNGIINLALTPAGTYTVIYTGAICGCFTNAPVSSTVQILAAPTISISGNSTVCSGAAITLSASGASSFIWSSGSTSSVMTDFPFAPVTSYTALGTDANGCSGTAVKSVSLVQTPTVTISGQPSVCIGYNYTLQANVTGTGAISYTWSGSAPVTGSGAIVNTSLTTSSNFSVIVSAGGCTASASLPVAAIPIPTISIIGSNTVCSGQRVTLYALGGATYTWSTGMVADSLATQPTTSTSYTVIGTDINGCSSSAIYNVNVFPVPSVSISGGPSVCSGKTTVLTGLGASSYSWSGGATVPAINFTPSADSTIFVIGTNAQGCKNTASVTIQVQPTPTVVVANASVCAGQSVQLTAEPQGTLTTGITYLWVPGSASGATYAPTPQAASVYTVSATVGTCVARATATVTVIQSTNALTAFSYVSPVCSGPNNVFPVLSGSFTSGGTYSATGLNIDPFTGMISLQGAAEGIYNIQYSVAPQGCRLGGSSGTFVQVKPQLQLTFPNDHFTIGPGESTTLVVVGDATDFIWSPSTGLNCSTCKNPVASPAVSTQYCVRSSAPCVNGGCIQVDVVCSRTGDFSVPNAFTPNGDGVNDSYCLKGWDECSKAFNVKIFDRWGEVIFESDNPNFCWDGRYKGDMLPTGVYIYFITADFDQIPDYKQSGNISLMR